MDTVDRIFDLLDNKGMEQKKFAELIGVSEDTVSNWRRRKSASYSKYIVQIAKILEASQEFLTTGQSPKEIPPPKTDADIMKQVERRYGKRTSEAMTIYVQLDDEDQILIQGRMLQLFESEKYSRNQELLNA